MSAEGEEGREEEWRIAANRAYEVSSFGRVRRILPGGGATPGKVKATIFSKWGYSVVWLWIGGKSRCHSVHSLVAEAFIGKRPLGLHINHKDGNKKNNRPENLEYVTQKQNALHAMNNNLVHHSEKSPHTKLSNVQVVEIYKAATAPGANLNAIGRKYGVSGDNVGWIRRRKTWRRVTDGL